MIPYTVPTNNNGKMSTKVLTEKIWPIIRPELMHWRLALVQDADSSHLSADTVKCATS